MPTTDRIPESAPYANGIFMECWDSPDADAGKWDSYRQTLQWAEKSMQYPRINCVETWYAESRNDLYRMRATTTLALTCSDGYSLFSDPNTLPTPDHLHDWYPFYDVNLGTPEANGIKLDNGAWQKEFTGGIVVYNPMGNEEVQIEFSVERTSATTGLKSKNNMLCRLSMGIYYFEGNCEYIYIKNEKH